MYDVEESALEKPPIAYVTEFDTMVAAVVDDGWVTLASTLFSPERPERVSDTGTLNGMVVDQVVEPARGVISHHVVTGGLTLPLAPGAPIHGQVDWGRRHTLMRLHTAQHLAYLGFEVVHGPARRLFREVNPNRAVIELEPTDPLPGPAAVDMVADWMARVVEDDLLIATLSWPAEPDRTYWYVDGVGSVACNGLHPVSTGEVGQVGLDASPGRTGSVRLTVTLG